METRVWAPPSKESGKPSLEGRCICSYRSQPVPPDAVYKTKKSQAGLGSGFVLATPTLPAALQWSSPSAEQQRLAAATVEKDRGWLQGNGGCSRSAQS